jgi:hypothetical protein
MISLELVDARGTFRLEADKIEQRQFARPRRGRGNRTGMQKSFESLYIPAEDRLNPGA